LQIIIGILLDKQPLYIKGVDDAEKGATNCYLGGNVFRFGIIAYVIYLFLAVLYIVSFVLSVGYWVYYEKTRAQAPSSISAGGFDNKQYGSFSDRR
jgi:hypothetical protein